MPLDLEAIKHAERRPEAEAKALRAKVIAEMRERVAEQLRKRRAIFCRPIVPIKNIGTRY